MENKIITRRRFLEDRLRTLKYQIENLQPYSSAAQIRTWRKAHASCVRQLELLPTVDQVKDAAKDHTAIVKLILRRL